FDMISSNIIGRDLHKESNYFVIDKGSKDGIKEGMPAIVNEGILIGKIEEVFYTHSKVLLVTSPNSNINAVTLETGSIGVVSGKYGLGMILDMVLQTDYLKIGDDVITSEISQNIPRGLLIGKIKEVYPSGGYLFQQAVISSPVDFSKMRFVFVIRNEK
ncbi:MAG: rod shape-determining protein MreC, partial [Parcubacteria group bacterium]